MKMTYVAAFRHLFNNKSSISRKIMLKVDFYFSTSFFVLPSDVGFHLHVLRLHFPHAECESWSRSGAGHATGQWELLYLWRIKFFFVCQIVLNEVSQKLFCYACRGPTCWTILSTCTSTLKLVFPFILWQKGALTSPEWRAWTQCVPALAVISSQWPKRSVMPQTTLIGETTDNFSLFYIKTLKKIKFLVSRFLFSLCPWTGWPCRCIGRHTS